jgi:hypothetical protein
MDPQRGGCAILRIAYSFRSWHRQGTWSEQRRSDFHPALTRIPWDNLARSADGAAGSNARAHDWVAGDEMRLLTWWQVDWSTMQ